MFKFEYNDEFKLQAICDIKPPVDPGEKFEFLSEFSKVFNKYEPFGKWMSDSNVSKEQKAAYEQSLKNAVFGLKFIYQLAQIIGVTDEELKEYTKIPF